MGGTGKKPQPGETTRDGGKNRRPTRWRTTTTRTAIWPRPNATATGKTMNQCDSGVGAAEILALDQPDAPRSRADARPSPSSIACPPALDWRAKPGGHRKRYGAEPVAAQRRQFLDTPGIGSASGGDTHALAKNLRRVPSRAAQPSNACMARWVRTSSRLSGAGSAFFPAKPAAANRPDRARRDRRSSVRPDAGCSR